MKAFYRHMLTQFIIDLKSTSTHPAPKIAAITNSNTTEAEEHRQTAKELIDLTGYELRRRKVAGLG